MNYGGDCRTAPATPGLLIRASALKSACHIKFAFLWVSVRTCFVWAVKNFAIFFKVNVFAPIFLSGELAIT